MSKVNVIFKSPKFVVLLTIIVVGAAGSFLGYQWMVSNVAQSNVSKAEIDVNGVKILSINSSAMDMQVNLTIDNPSSHEAEVKNSNLNVSVSDGTEEVTIGSLNLNGLQLNSGVNRISHKFTLTYDSADAFNTFARMFLSRREISIRLSGRLDLSVTDLLIPVETEVSFDKSLSIVALDGLRNITITGIGITNTSENALGFILNASIYNPSLVSVNIALMRWDVNYNGVNIARLAISNVQLKPGVNEITATGTAYANETNAIQDMISKYLSGENISVTLDGSLQIGFTGLSSYVLSNVQLQATITCQKGIQVSIMSIRFVEIAEDYIKANVEIEIDNPSEISGVIENLSLDIFYSDELIGVVNVSNIYLVHGVNIFNVNVTFSPANKDTITKLATDYLSGKEITIIVKGSKTGNVLSRLLNNWTQEVVISNTQSISLNVSKVGLINSTSDSLFLYFEFQIVNPIDANIELSNFTLNVTLTDNNAYLGNITIPLVSLKPGLNNISVSAKFSPENASLVADLVNRYINNEDINITLTNISPNTTLISRILYGYSVNITIHGVNPVNIFIVSMNVLDVTSSNVTMEVNVSITNPTATTIHMDSVIFQVEYENGILGNVSLGSIDVAPGTHMYTINVVFTPSNTMLLVVMATNYVNGNPINVTVKGYATSNDVLSLVLRNYVANITIPALNLQFHVDSFDLLETTNTTLIFGVNVTLSNTLQTSIDVWNITFLIYYNNIYIGNCTANYLSLLPGTHTYLFNGTLDASANRTNISAFLSDYIAGKDITLYLSGSIMTDMSGLIQNTAIPVSYQYVLPGIQKTLIDSVSVASITININTMTVDITTRATINNPMNFNISIVSLQYDIYFDDNDGAYITIGFISYSYPPAQNILISSISENLTASPINLSANGSTTISETVSISNTELAVRLYDEYTLKNQLKVNILNGLMTIKIGVFEVQIAFEFYNVPVS